jgi:hypothetical protein
MAPLIGPDMAQHCPIIYVSTKGSDTSSGCTPAAAKKTISAAITLLTTADQEVHVCSGLYQEENLVIAGTLRGGYDCDSWQRTMSYGYPDFDGQNETMIVKLGHPGSSATLTVAPGKTLIDGFTITGSSSGTSGTIAVALIAGHAQLSNDKIIGGTIASGSAIALLVEGDADANITQNNINGGAGAMTTYGSIGIEANSTGAVHIFGNTISGGSGSGDETGSIGVLIRKGTLTTAAGTALENNSIFGGYGVGAQSYTAKGVSILAGSATVDVIGNQIDGGHANGGWDGTCGVYADAAGPLRILSNRIYGGKAAAPTGMMGSWGIKLYTQQPAEIANNMIHGGDANDFHAAGNSGLWVAGIGVGSFTQNAPPAWSGAIIHHNTIIGGVTAGGAMPLFLNAAGSVVENNILASNADRSPYPAALYTDYCMSNGIIHSFRNNVTMNTYLLEYGSDPSFNAGDLAKGCTSWKQFNDTQSAENQITTQFRAAVGGNVSFKFPSCGTDPRCLPLAGCSGVDQCYAALFSSWDIATTGARTVLDTGLHLNANIPCAVAQSSLDLTTQVPFDFYGTIRSLTPSMGAAELTGLCTK